MEACHHFRRMPRQLQSPGDIAFRGRGDGGLAAFALVFGPRPLRSLCGGGVRITRVFLLSKACREGEKFCTNWNEAKGTEKHVKARAQSGRIKLRQQQRRSAVFSENRADSEVKERKPPQCPQLYYGTTTTTNSRTKREQHGFLCKARFLLLPSPPRRPCL